MKNLSVTAAIFVAVVGAVAGFVGFRLYGVPHTYKSMAPLAVGSTPIAPSAPQTAAATVPVPESVPDVHMPDLQGHARAMSEFDGRPRIINFWATWCGPCRREIPLLNSLQRTHQAQRLQIIGIAIDFNKAVQDYVKKTRIDYPVFIGEDAGLEAAQKFGISDLVLPFSVFADAKNRVVAVKVGELHPPEAEFILKAIARLDAGQSDLPATRSAIEDELKQEAQQRAQPAAPAT